MRSDREAGILAVNGSGTGVPARAAFWARASLSGLLLMLAQPAGAQEYYARTALSAGDRIVLQDPLPPVLRARYLLAVEAAEAAELPGEVKQSIGCLVTGSIGTVGAVVAGGENLVNIIAGGVVAPQNRAVLYIGIVGVVFASFCAIGQALTPLYLHMVEPASPADRVAHGRAQPARLDTILPPVRIFPVSAAAP